MMDGRRLILLLRSLGLGAGSAALAAGLGFFVALYLWGCKKPGRPLALLCFALPLSPMVYANAFSYLTGLLGIRSPSWVSVWVVNAAAMIPLCALPLYRGLLAVPKEELYAARLLRGDSACLFHIALGQNLPLLASSALLSMLLCMLDYNVPSLFGVPVYALDIFASFSATGDAKAAFGRSLPLMVSALLLLIFLLLAVRDISLANPAGNDGISDWGGSAVALLTGAGFLVHLIVPAAAACSALPLLTDTQEFLTAAAASLPELGYTLRLCGGAAIVGALLALLVSRSGLGVALSLLLAAIPPALWGIGLLHALSPLRIFDRLLPALALVLRFMPFSAAALYIARKSVPREEGWAASLFAPNRGAWLLRYLLPARLPLLALGALLQFALSLGELGATLLLLPPGRVTVNIKLYNYLHYGASPGVSAICLLICIVTIAVVAAAFFVWRQSERRRGGDPND